MKPLKELPVNNKTEIEDCKTIQLHKINFREGNLTPVETIKDIPFDIKRVFFLYDIPGGEARGAHAHYNCHQFLIAASGSFDVELSDGKSVKVISLNRPYYGIHIPPGIWAAEKNFSSGAICLVLASEKFNEKDYIRNFNEYLKFRNDENSSNS
jgi:hypothetical protein